MPNHVHVLLRLLNEESLSNVMHSLKSYTAHEANKLLARRGRFWFKESFDRYIRDMNPYRSVVAYIENNPVKAGLCHEAERWQFGSANYEYSQRFIEAST